MIVDLSRGGEGVLQYASERIISFVLDRAAERFRTGRRRTGSRSSSRRPIACSTASASSASSGTDPYVRLAREAGKYKLGMI